MFTETHSCARRHANVDITLELLSLGGVYPQSKHMNNGQEYSKLRTRYAQTRDYRNLCGTNVTHLRLLQWGPSARRKILWSESLNIDGFMNALKIMTGMSHRQLY